MGETMDRDRINQNMEQSRTQFTAPVHAPTTYVPTPADYSLVVRVIYIYIYIYISQ